MLGSDRCVLLVLQQTIESVGLAAKACLPRNLLTRPTHITLTFNVLPKHQQSLGIVHDSTESLHGIQDVQLSTNGLAYMQNNCLGKSTDYNTFVFEYQCLNCNSPRASNPTNKSNSACYKEPCDMRHTHPSTHPSTKLTSPYRQSDTNQAHTLPFGSFKSIMAFGEPITICAVVRKSRVS